MNLQKHADPLKGHIDFVSSLKLRNLFPGEWESIFKGEGMEFSESRPFEPGDRPRDIDLAVLAQSDEEEVALRDETRQMKVYIWADFSGSLRPGQSIFASKSLVRDIAAGLVLFSAQKAYSPVGLYAFGLESPKFFRPKMGEGYCLEIWNWLREEAPHLPFSSSGLEPALSSLVKLATPSNLVFFLSDFQQKVFEGDFTRLLRPIVSRFDLIPVVILSPLESGGKKLPYPVRVRVASSKGTRELYLTPDAVRHMQQAMAEHIEHLTNTLRRLGLSPIVLSSPTVEDCAKKFFQFFEARKREKR